MLALHVTGPALALGRQLHPTTNQGRELMKTLASVSIACCLGLAAAGVAAQDEGCAETRMTAADCKTYMDGAAKDAKMKNADKDAQCKALADKEGSAKK